MDDAWASQDTRPGVERAGRGAERRPHIAAVGGRMVDPDSRPLDPFPESRRYGAGPSGPAATTTRMDGWVSTRYAVSASKGCWMRLGLWRGRGMCGGCNCVGKRAVVVVHLEAAGAAQRSAAQRSAATGGGDGGASNEQAEDTQLNNKAHAAAAQRHPFEHAVLSSAAAAHSRQHHPAHCTRRRARARTPSKAAAQSDRGVQPTSSVGRRLAAPHRPRRPAAAQGLSSGSALPCQSLHIALLPLLLHSPHPPQSPCSALCNSRRPYVLLLLIA